MRRLPADHIDLMVSHIVPDKSRSALSQQLNGVGHPTDVCKTSVCSGTCSMTCNDTCYTVTITLTAFVLAPAD